MSKNGWMRVGVGEVQAAAGDEIAAPSNSHFAAIDLGVAEQQRPIERAAQVQIGAGDDRAPDRFDAQRATARSDRTSKRNGRTSAADLPFDGRQRRFAAGEAAEQVARGVEAARPAGALHVHRARSRSAPSPGPAARASASTIERMPSGYRRRMSCPVAVTSNSLS